MTDTKSEIKGDPYQKRKHYVLVFIICACFFVAIECLSWAGLHLVWKTTGKTILPLEYTQSFSPFSSKNIFPILSEYRPYYMVGRIPNTPIMPRTLFGTDKHGYVVNNINQLERDLSSPSGRYRIFLFGNSTIMGTGSTVSLAAYLEKALNVQGEKRFEVITGGDDGFNSGQELSRLAMETLYYHPDMVITFNGVADAFMSSFLNDRKPNTHIHGKVIKESLKRNSLHNQSLIEVNISSLDFFLRRFYSYHILNASFSKIGIQLTDPYSIEDQKLFDNSLMNAPVFDRRGVDVFLENLVSISAICNVRGIRTIHLLQPTLATELIRRGEGATESEWNLLETQGVKRTYTRLHRAEVFDRFYKYSRAGFKDRGNIETGLQNWIDLSEFFNDVPELTDVYRDAVHYQDLPTQKLSQKIARIVREVLFYGTAD